MNLTLADVQRIVKESDALESPWRERFIALANDWMAMTKMDLEKVQEELGLARTLKLGAEAVAQLDTVEEILQLPLCDKCRRLIGEDQLATGDQNG